MGWIQVVRIVAFCEFYLHFRLGVIDTNNHFLISLDSITTFSLASLVLSSRLISLHLPSTCAAMSLGAAIITSLTFPIMWVYPRTSAYAGIIDLFHSIFLDYFCNGTHTPPIIVEIFWCGVYTFARSRRPTVISSSAGLSGILWLVASGMTAIFFPQHVEFCDTNVAICREVRIAEVLSIIAACIRRFLTRASSLAIFS
jgi:hypothetical protein